MTPIRIAISLIALGIPPILVTQWVGNAEERLEQIESNPGEDAQVAIAAQADEGYCNAGLRQVLRRVLASCGLAGGETRGCQPVDAKNVATMAGEDFNALLAEEGLPRMRDDNSKESRDRRRLFVAIARGIVRHLDEHRTSITVTVPDGGGTVSPEFDIDGKDW